MGVHGSRWYQMTSNSSNKESKSHLFTQEVFSGGVPGVGMDAPS